MRTADFEVRPAAEPVQVWTDGCETVWLEVLHETGRIDVSLEELERLHARIGDTLAHLRRKRGE